jgi:hypothetical protein
MNNNAPEIWTSPLVKKKVFPVVPVPLRKSLTGNFMINRKTMFFFSYYLALLGQKLKIFLVP